MSQEHVFVEEYRKELAATGYPFSKFAPIVTDTGYTLPFGTIIDASVYLESAKIPKLTAIEKDGANVTFFVDDAAAVLDLRHPLEVLELYHPSGIFGGILVCDTQKAAILQGWRNGRHGIQPALSFCPRCLEPLPQTGVQRFRADTGEIFSGNVVLIMGVGGIMQVKTAPAGFPYMETHFTGDPTWQIRHGATEATAPVQSILCTDTNGNEFLLAPGEWHEIGFIACNTQENNLHKDALRINAAGSSVSWSLGGL